SHLLDLTDPLAGEPELAAHLVERALAAVVEAEAQPDHRALALGQRREDDLHLVAEHPVGYAVGRLLPGVDARHEVTERALPVLADRLIEADRLAVVRDQLDHLELRYPQGLGDLADARLPSKARRQVAARPYHPVDLLDH